jgi:hypothetical protein
MYPASDWSVCAPGHHGYQRACELISGQASIGPFGSPVFACTGKTDPPFRLILRLILSQTWVTSLPVPSCRAVPVHALRPIPSSRPARAGAPARKGPASLAAARALPRAS